ncbi:MAG TPA: hypothetical protein VJ065_00765 [Patescibacteria group bacterium]|nr:hypothetical protein [Patescibacteria group bacterium]
MNARFWGFVFLNFCAVLLLTALIAGPLLVAKNMAKVAGVKSESRYLVVSQIEKFPNLILSQKENVYSISYTKQSPAQAYIGVLIVNNPTATTQTYNLEIISGEAKPFFGENPDDQLTKIAVPASASVALSLFSSPEASSEAQTVEFRISE